MRFLLWLRHAFVVFFIAAKSRLFSLIASSQNPTVPRLPLESPLSPPVHDLQDHDLQDYDLQVHHELEPAYDELDLLSQLEQQLNLSPASLEIPPQSDSQTAVSPEESLPQAPLLVDKPLLRSQTNPIRRPQTSRHPSKQPPLLHSLEQWDSTLPPPSPPSDLPPILTSKYSLTQLLLPLPANHPSPSHLLDYAYIPPNTYTPSDRPFASGSNGRVYRATAADGTNVILKQMLLTDPPIGDAARREIHFGSSLPPHPALVTYIEHFKNADETEVWLVFGDAGDSLRNFLYTAAKTPDETVIYMPSEMWKQMRNLAADKTFTVIKSSEKSVTLTAPTTPPPPPPPPPPSSAATDLLQKILFQVLSAAAHLHSNGVIHRDIKPSNIFCTLPDLDAVDCVLGDLSSGISPFSLNNLYKHEPASHLQETLQYTPPEYHLNPSNPPPYSPSFDSWSIGVTALEMLLGTPDVFSIDSRTEALLRAQLKKTHTPEPDIETALLLASFADYCIFDPKGATESGWLSDGDPLGEMSMVANSCGLEDFKRALLQRDSTQLGFNSPSSTRLLMLIWQLLSWDPKSRLTPEEALKHNYFAAATPVPSHTHRHDVAHPDVTFTCPVCGRSYVSHESCQTHVKGRKHGQFCEHEWEGGADFECLSSHFLMPIDDESGYCDNQGRRSVIEDFHSIEFNERGKVRRGGYVKRRCEAAWNDRKPAEIREPFLLMPSKLASRSLRPLTQAPSSTACSTGTTATLRPSTSLRTCSTLSPTARSKRGSVE